jgi:hypothetical protein
MRKIVRVLVFVDWDTARRVVPVDLRLGQGNLAGRSVRRLQDEIASMLSQVRADAFRVTFRLYHGWYRGKSKTADRIELERWLGGEPVQRVVGNVSFAPEMEFCDRLLCGGERSAIFDTLRKRGDDSDEQKMVDTSLVADLLQFARSERGAVAVVVGDDDDLLPGVFVADAWGMEVLVARQRQHDNGNLNSAGLVRRMGRG